MEGTARPWRKFTQPFPLRRHRKAQSSPYNCEAGCLQVIRKASHSICLHVWNTSLKTFLLHYLLLQQMFIVHLLHIWFSSRYGRQDGEKTRVPALTEFLSSDKQISEYKTWGQIRQEINVERASVEVNGRTIFPKDGRRRPLWEVMLEQSLEEILWLFRARASKA